MTGFERHIVESVGVATDSVDWEAGTTNAASARRRQLEAALPDIEAAVESSNVSPAQDALKRALEAIHELNDSLGRGEWNQGAWDAGALGLWRAHVGARNAAHHNSYPLVVLHGSGTRDERLRWALDPRAVTALRQRSKAQAREYEARLDGQPVLPALRAIAAGVAAAVS